MYTALQLPGFHVGKIPLAACFVTAAPSVTSLSDREFSSRGLCDWSKGMIVTVSDVRWLRRVRRRWKWMFSIVSAVTRQYVPVLALLCCNKTPVLITLRYFGLIAGLIWFVRKSQYETLVPLAPVDMSCTTSEPWWPQNTVRIPIPPYACLRNFGNLAS